jgi:hypothetical protein
VVKLSSPTVRIWSSSAAGGFSGELIGYRDKRDGSCEEVRIDFPALSIWELRCLGKSAIEAMRSKRTSIQTKLHELADEAGR